jgi:hypothetical protein
MEVAGSDLSGTTKTTSFLINYCHAIYLSAIDFHERCE